MIDVQDLLRQKENDINRVRKEIHALQLVAPLLSDSEEVSAAPSQAYPETVDATAAQNATTDAPNTITAIEPEPAEASSEPIPPKRGILRDWFSRAAGE